MIAGKDELHVKADANTPEEVDIDAVADRIRKQQLGNQVSASEEVHGDIATRIHK